MSNRTAKHIRRDLEDRGVPEPVSTELSARMAEEAEHLDAGAYEGFLAGAALSFSFHREANAEDPASAKDLGEIQRLMSDFSDELRKLDEALEILAAYVVRMRTQSDPKDRTLH
ncbi:MAG: hypothetical protein JRH01_25235 [Deltaproteobacteria bacterium]|nr:hypothetical protein [Deltaproteobacteria bacterium]MBW2397233.1 hypothetical protein [Deltaproteobacteria bacterium]